MLGAAAGWIGNLVSGFLTAVYKAAVLALAAMWSKERTRRKIEEHARKVREKQLEIAGRRRLNRRELLDKWMRRDKGS